MKKVIASLLALTLITPAIAFAHPGGWGPGPHGHWGGGGGPLRFLPDAAVGVLIGGLTYYMLNGNYYQRQGDNYVVVEPPAAEPAREMRVLDFTASVITCRMVTTISARLMAIIPKCRVLTVCKGRANKNGQSLRLAVYCSDEDY